jgi:tRNA-Thr(GGU) m(6)t(6)A37 methyltransferase TsaA
MSGGSASQTKSDIRPGEVAVAAPARADATLTFIGALRTPWKERRECPRQGDHENGPLCRVEVDEPWRAALKGIGQHTHLQLLYWMHLARRDLVEQSPRHNGQTTGTFALRSPIRPNPVSASLVTLVEAHDDHLIVRGLDCVDGTPLIDIKPEKCPEAPTPKQAVHP